MQNKEIRFASRPAGLPTPENFQIVDSEMPQLNDGEVLVRTLYISVDPYLRGRMREGRSYVPPFAIGEVIMSGVVGEVVESRAPGFAAGDIVTGTSPTKVAPQNPGGVEIPDQNKQIYERGGQDGTDQDREPRGAADRCPAGDAGRPRPVKPSGPLPSNVVPSVNPAPPQYGSINAALGEPRRVRTVSVGPDGTLKTPEQGAGRPAAGSAATPPQPAPTTAGSVVHAGSAAATSAGT